MSDMEKFDVMVLGGGSGLTAAYHAGMDGKSVALIEERAHALGGTCLNRGFIPTKGLIQSAEVMNTIRDAHKFGIHLDRNSIRVDFKTIMETVRELFTREFGKRVSLELNTRAIEAVTREGRRGFVLEKDGERRTLLADAILVAAGRRPNTDGLALGQTGVETDERGWVHVDERLQTTHPDIYAYGDVIGPQAADLVHEVVVAMNAGDGSADLVRNTIHIHPTLPELIRQVFDELG